MLEFWEMASNTFAIHRSCSMGHFFGKIFDTILEMSSSQAVASTPGAKEITSPAEILGAVAPREATLNHPVH